MQKTVPAPDFSCVFQSLPGLYLVLSPDLSILAASDAFLRATKTEREEIVGYPFFEVFPENPRDPAASGARDLRSSFERVLQEREPDTMAVQKYDIRRPPSEGGASEERFWSVVNSPMFGPDRKVEFIIHCVEDVTDLVKLREGHSPDNPRPGGNILSEVQELQEANRRMEVINRELHRSELRFRSLVSVVKDYGIFMLDPEGRVSTWNAGAEQIKGYAAEEIVGQHFSRFYTPEDRDQKKPDAELETAKTAGKFEEEGWRVRKDGSQFWANVVITAIRDSAGNLSGFTKVTRDLTDRKNAEETLRRSELHSRLLFEFSPDAILACNQQGRITDANSRVENLFGYSKAELLGQPVEILIPERFHAVHPGHRAAYTSEPRMRPMGVGLELHGRRKDGTEFPADIMLGSADTEAGRIVLSVIRDLSERKKYQEALHRSEEEKRYLAEELSTTYQFEEIVGDSPELKRVLKQVETVAKTDATVLILGETGTGKELIARAIHNLSPRSERTFVKLNCSAIPTGLLESELFGHERGAFTGAIAQKIGRLELANQGTLFLDEIGDLPLELQPKILRALQEKEFERLGGTRTIPVNVRLVAATNRNLARMVEAGQFRSDLYYRLRVFPVSIPSLRERRQDIPLLVNYFVSQHAKRMNRPIVSVPDDVMQALCRWRWPGNVRELENFIERAVILTQGTSLRAPLAELQQLDDTPDTGDPNLEAAEREHILKVLRECRGAIGGPKGAAERLGLKRTTLNSKMRKLGIQRRDYI